MRTACLLLIIAAAQAELPPPPAWPTAEGKSGAALKAELHQLIRGHRVSSYSATRQALEALDQSPADPAKLRLVYSGLDDLKANFGDAAGWNREHLWPDSYGLNGRTPAYSDLHNLRACDATVNSSRGNLPYDESLAADGNLREPAHPEAPGTSRDANSWEPQEQEKGDLARALFYMAVRYEGSGGEPDLELTDDMASITSGGSRMGRLTTLLEWHLLDPPDERERTRMETVYASYQQNRNPFVDQPAFALLIWGHPLRLEARPGPAGSVELRWPDGLRRAVLQTSADLLNWETITPTIRRGGGECIAELPTAAPLRFYRLALE